MVDSLQFSSLNYNCTISDPTFAQRISNKLDNCLIQLKLLELEKSIAELNERLKCDNIKYKRRKKNKKNKKNKKK